MIKVAKDARKSGTSPIAFGMPWRFWSELIRARYTSAIELGF